MGATLLMMALSEEEDKCFSKTETSLNECKDTYYCFDALGFPLGPIKSNVLKVVLFL